MGFEKQSTLDKTATLAIIFICRLDFFVDIFMCAYLNILIT